jgi:hypothetical protein
MKTKLIVISIPNAKYGTLALNEHNKEMSVLLGDFKGN